MPLTSIVADANTLVFPNPVLLLTLARIVSSYLLSVFNFITPLSTDNSVVVTFPFVLLPTNTIVLLLTYNVLNGKSIEPKFHVFA